MKTLCSAKELAMVLSTIFQSKAESLAKGLRENDPNTLAKLRKIISLYV